MRFRTLISGKGSLTGSPIFTHVLSIFTTSPTAGTGGHVLTEGLRWDWISSGRKTRIPPGSQNGFFIPGRLPGFRTGHLTSSTACGLIKKVILNTPVQAF